MSISLEGTFVLSSYRSTIVPYTHSPCGGIMTTSHNVGEYRVEKH